MGGQGRSIVGRDAEVARLRMAFDAATVRLGPGADAVDVGGADFLAVIDWIERARPLVIVVDDAQWADDPHQHGGRVRATGRGNVRHHGPGARALSAGREQR